MVHLDSALKMSDICVSHSRWLAAAECGGMRTCWMNPGTLFFFAWIPDRSTGAPLRGERPTDENGPTVERFRWDLQLRGGEAAHRSVDCISDPSELFRVSFTHSELPRAGGSGQEQGPVDGAQKAVHRREEVPAG